MNVKQLAAHLIDLIHQGYGDQEIVAYIKADGEPLEVVEVHYDEDGEEVSLALDY